MWDTKYILTCIQNVFQTISLQEIEVGNKQQHFYDLIISD